MAIVSSIIHDILYFFYDMCRSNLDRFFSRWLLNVRHENTYIFLTYSKYLFVCMERGIFVVKIYVVKLVK